MFPLSDFKKMIKLTPLTSIGLIVRNPQGKILLGERLNKPAQGFWFVPRARVLKGEALEGLSKFNQSRAELGLY